jgi:hypothetical protein
LALALDSQPQSIDPPPIQQPVALVPSPPAAALVTPLVIAHSIAAVQASESTAFQPAALILPPAISVRAELVSNSSAIAQPEMIQRSEVRTAPLEVNLSLRDAALLAYRPETGGSAMSWPLDEAEEPAAADERKDRKPPATSSAAGAVARHPRPADVAAEKTAARR